MDLDLKELPPAARDYIEQVNLKWQHQLGLQKKELFFWFHAETRKHEEACMPIISEIFICDWFNISIRDTH